jgi:hypothetical protein
MKTFSVPARVVAGTLVLVLALAVCGCSGGTGTVSGKVTYQGKAVPGGTVTCMTKNNHPFMGKIESDGSYTVNGVPTGPVTVAVEAGVGADEPPLPLPGKDPPPKAPVTPAPKVPTIMQIPRQYANPDSSGLGLTVARGGNPFNIDLK